MTWLVTLPVTLTAGVDDMVVKMALVMTSAVLLLLLLLAVVMLVHSPGGADDGLVTSPVTADHVVTLTSVSTTVWLSDDIDVVSIKMHHLTIQKVQYNTLLSPCLLYTSPSPRDS